MSFKIKKSGENVSIISHWAIWMGF